LRIPAKAADPASLVSNPELDMASSALPVILAIRSMERYLYISPAYERIYGHEPSALFESASAALDRVHPEDRDMMRVRMEADRSGAAQEYEFRVKNHFGDYRRLNVKVHPFFEGASGELLIASLTEDITDLVLPPARNKNEGAAGAKGVRAAEFRQALMNCVDDWCSSEAAPFFAIAFVDLARFRAVNDSFGFSEGDRLLEEVQRRIAAVLPAEDRVAGFGSDRFGLLVRSAGEAAKVEELVRKILTALAEPFTIGTNQISVSARAGLAYPRGMDCTVDMLLRNADAALQLAKQRREGLVVSTISRASRSMEQSSLEFDLSSALDKDEFFFEFQPVFEPESGKVALLEALVRWRHPRLGVISPASFISLAEDSGLVLRLDMQGLERLARQLEYWRLLEPKIRQVPVSINISGRHFPSFVMEKQFHKLLKQPAIQASKIIFEITESVFVDSNQRTAAGLGRLRDAGVKIWLDDFGEGYSSFKYLSHFPVDGIKISESFVKNCVREEKSRVILKTLKSLAEHMGIEIVVEGIENQEQLGLLRDMGFGLVQGYYLSRPLAASEIPELLGGA
jgi:diguanylate cyclase (GGDEF)-like protein/PAS domain S-box-containing protein